MLLHIAELNRVLITAKALTVEGKYIEKKLLIEHCKDVAIEGRMPNHAYTIEFSADMGLLNLNAKKKIQLSNLGIEFLDFNPEGLYDLSDMQKQFLIRKFFLDGKFRGEVKDCLKCFVASESKGTFYWSSIDGTPFGKNAWIINHLEQLDVIQEVENGYIVRKEFLETITTFINEPKGFTEAQLYEWLSEKKILGDAAEHLVIEFEKNRLRGLGMQVEASCVRPVGKLKTDAGYDIESFNGKSNNMHFDRFIEVKGSGDPKLRFVWSQNEMRVAEKLRDKYWIYFQGGVDKKTGKSKYKPILIQDPFHTIPLDSNLTKVDNGIVVSGSMKGELL